LGISRETFYRHLRSYTQQTPPIGRPTGTNLAPFYANFPDLWIYKPTGEQLAASIAAIGPSNVAFTLVNPTSSGQAQISSGGVVSNVGVFLDTRVRNFGRNWIEGIDFSVDYTHETGFGSVDLSVAGNIPTRRDSQQSPLAEVSDSGYRNGSHLRLSTMLGANIGQLRAQGTWNHSAGYLRSDAGTAAAFGQERVGAFDVFNLFFKYDVPGSGLADGLSFTANVGNVFDTDPPVYKSTGLSGYDPDHSQTLGRSFQFGVQKKF
jgi:iron complex outermembrane receptor protein